MSSCFRVCSGGSTSDWDYSTRKEIEPHPEVFQVLECVEGSNYLYVVVKYPHCTNFEGEKVLVLKDTSPHENAKSKVIYNLDGFLNESDGIKIYDKWDFKL